MDDTLDRLSANLATMIAGQARHAQDQIDSFSRSVERFAARVTDAVERVTGRPAGSAPAAPAVAGGGPLAVMIVNAASNPVAVRLVTAAEQKAAEPPGLLDRIGGFLAGAVGAVGGAVGNFVGGVIGGAAMPIALPVTMIAAIPLVIEFTNLVKEIKGALMDLLDRFSLLIDHLIDQLTAAGLLPITKLLATFIGGILLLVDNGLRLILAYLKPIMDWLKTVIEKLAEWLGKFINELLNVLRGTLNDLPRFLAEILDKVVRPAVKAIVADTMAVVVEKLLSTLVGAALGIGAAIYEAVGPLIDTMVWMVRAVSDFLGKVFTGPPQPGDLMPRMAKAFGTGMKVGGGLGRAMAHELVGHPGDLPTVPGGPMPQIKIPGFHDPGLKLDTFPATPSQLQDVLNQTARPTGLVPDPNALPAPAPGVGTPPPTAGIVVNGGIHVQVSAATVDASTAEGTARAIAEKLMAELRRLTERERFRLGLSTGPLS